MSKLLHKNSKGIKMLREDYKLRSQVKVFTEDQGKRYILRSYRFNRISDCFASPYLSWANLDCCGGWNYEEAYLDTAVLDGKKLYASKAQILKTQYFPDAPSKEQAMQQFQIFMDTLPEGVAAGVEGTFDSEDYLHTFICREGKISDFFDINSVFEFYGKLGLMLPQAVKKQVVDFCETDIKTFGGEAPPFLYYQASTPAEFITTGLLLGYPIESTASILSGY